MTTREKSKASWTHLNSAEGAVFGDPVIQGYFKANKITSANSILKLTEDKLSQSFKMATAASEIDEVLSDEQRSIILDSAEWFMAQDKRNVETWLTLDADTLDDFQLEMSVAKHSAAAKLKEAEDEAKFKAIETIAAVDKAKLDAELLKVEEAKLLRDKADMAVKQVEASNESPSVNEDSGESTVTRFSLSKGVKRDPAVYPKFSDPAKYAHWTTKFRTVANMHGVGKVLDKDYKPESAADKAEFQDMQAFMFLAIQGSVTVNESAGIIARFSETFDAQGAYQAIVKRFGQGQAANIRADALELELTTFRLDNGWNKPIAAFLTTQSDKATELEVYRPESVTSGKRLQWLRFSMTLHDKMQAAVEAFDTNKALTDDRYAGLRASNPDLFTEEEAAITYRMLSDHLMRVALVLDAQNSRARTNNGHGGPSRGGTRAANSAARGRGRDGTRGGGRGGRGDGRGYGRGRGRGVTAAQMQAILQNPTGFVADEQYRALSQEQYQAWQSARDRANAAATRSATSSNRGGQVPNAVDVQETASQVPSELTRPDDATALLRQFLEAPTERTANTASSRNSAGRTITFTVTTATRTVANARHHDPNLGSLIDGGANGGLAGRDMLKGELTRQVCNVIGLADTTVENLEIGTGYGYIETTIGPHIGVFPQYAFYDGAESIHSPSQLRANGMLVDDINRLQQGRQIIVSQRGVTIPLQIRGGLPHMDMRPPTEAEMASDTIPRLYFTADDEWVPRMLDNEWTEAELAELPERDLDHGFLDPRVDDLGNIIHHAHHVNVEACIADATAPPLTRAARNLHAHRAIVNVAKPDYKALRPYLGYCSELRAKKTLEATTQHYRATMHNNLRHSTKSRFPGHGKRFNDDVAMDMIYSDVEALDDGIPGHGGCRFAQLFVGKATKLTMVEPMRTEGDTSRAIERFIQMYGAPNTLISDNSRAQNSKVVDAIMLLYKIGRQFTEPGMQQQNPAEREIQVEQQTVDGIMNRHNIPANRWLIILLFASQLLNHLALESLGWKSPIEAAFNYKPDLSPYLEFHVHQRVIYELGPGEAQPDEPVGIRKAHEGVGRWYGPAPNHGDILTYYILSDKTEKMVIRSKVRPFIEGERNLRAEADARSSPEGEVGVPARDGVPALERNSYEEDDDDDDEDVPPLRPRVETVDEDDDEDSVVEESTRKFVHSAAGDAGYNFGDESGPNRAPFFSQDEFLGYNRAPYYAPDELLGRTVLLNEEDGSVMRYTVVKQIMDRDAANHEKIKFLLSVGDGTLEELITYNELSDLVERQMDAELRDEVDYFAFDAVVGHQGPMNHADPRYRGSSYNVQVQWTTGEKTWEPLAIMIKDDPITVAQYAQEKGLLDCDGWKRLKRYTRRKKKFDRQVKAAKTQAARDAKQYKFGVQIPRNWNDARRLDEENGNTLWADAIATELAQLNEYETFQDKGVGARMGSEWKRINLHLIFDCKHDLRRKARMVAGGHLTAPPKDSAYSGVVSLRSIRLIATVAELNGLDFWAADIGNAYLEAVTQEKVYVIAGPEFGALQGHTLVIFKALYGLRTSGARWHEHFSDTLRDMGFFPSWADSDVWMKDCGTHYEYVCVFVDDLALAMKDPKAFCNLLRSKYNYKLKGDGPISYHLGADFFRDPDGTLCMSAKTYIGRLLKNYETMFGQKPIKRLSPLDDGDHPEMDISEELDADGVRQYQSIIGALQWAVSLCRYDIHCAVMTMGRFRVAPRKGHLDRAKRIVGYLARYPNAAIRFRTHIPNTGEEPPVYDWIQTAYGPCEEELPWNMPEPKGKPMRLSAFEDANLYHCLVTGRAAMGMLYFANQTPIEWFCKRQNTVETATYGSEFVGSKTCVEHIMDHRYCMRMLGIPLDGPAWMFGDNQSVVTSSTIPHSSLTKRHNALAYHRVREAIAAKVVFFKHISGKQNPADVLTKFLPHATFHPLIKYILLWRGNTVTGSEVPQD